MISGLRFLNLGALSIALVVGLTAALHELLGIAEQSSYLVALVAAFCINFTGARYYVYRVGHSPIGRQLMRFLVSSIAFRGGEFISFVLLHTIAGVQYLITVGLIMVTSFVLKYLFYRTFVFS